MEKKTEMRNLKNVQNPGNLRKKSCLPTMTFGPTMSQKSVGKCTPKNYSTWREAFRKGKRIFQPQCFRCYVSCRKGKNFPTCIPNSLSSGFCVGPPVPLNSLQPESFCQGAFQGHGKAILNLLADWSIIKKNLQTFDCCDSVGSMCFFFAHGKTTQIGDFLHIT